MITLANTKQGNEPGITWIAVVKLWVKVQLCEESWQNEPLVLRVSW